jgi:hypothetical protein
VNCAPIPGGVISREGNRRRLFRAWRTGHLQGWPAVLQRENSDVIDRKKVIIRDAVAYLSEAELRLHFGQRGARGRAHREERG